jgi:hypothetical protein
LCIWFLRGFRVAPLVFYSAFVSVCAVAAYAQIPTDGDVQAWRRPVSDIFGQQITLSDKLESKAWVLVFILSDCPIGNSYLPQLQRLDELFKGRGVNFVLVHADSQTTPQQAQEHAREFKIVIPVLLDPRHEWVQRAGATIAPEAAVFSPQGVLLYRGRIDNRYAGLGKRRMVVTEHDLRDALDAILEERPVKKPRTEAVGCLIPELSNGK